MSRCFAGTDGRTMPQDPKILRREAPRRCDRCLGRQIATREIGDLTTDDRKNAAAWAGR
jgi:hypothetical protein